MILMLRSSSFSSPTEFLYIFLNAKFLLVLLDIKALISLSQALRNLSDKKIRINIPHLQKLSRCLCYLGTSWSDLRTPIKEICSVRTMEMFNAK